MQFQIVLDAVLQTLADDSAAGSGFDVVGFQRRAISAKTALIASVQLFYNSGDFPISGGSFVGDSVKHNIDFKIEMTVAGKALGDLSGLENATTPAQISTALGSFQDAAELVDRAIDQLWSDVWNILMDAKNETYGLPVGAVSSRWVNGFQKDQPSPKGEMVILTANAILRCCVDESVLGVIGTPGIDYDVSLININGDTEQQTGAAGELGENE